MNQLSTLVMLLAGALLYCATRASIAADSGSLGATWQQPKPAEVQARLTGWLDQQKVDAAVRAEAMERWSHGISTATDSKGTDVLGSLVAALAVVDPRINPVLEYTRAGGVDAARPDVQWLSGEKLAPLERNNLRLLLGRRLVQLQLFDEALEQMAGLEPSDVVDPAGLLFYSGLAHHRLLHREEGLTAIARLLERRDELPARYAALASLMDADLRQLKDESLDHISRRMEDIQRRLDQGRTEPKVRELEDGVVKSLDKMIKQLEDQMAASNAAASLQPAAPAQDSMPASGKGPGLVTKKAIGKNTEWGDLPPKDRQETLQEIGRDFPANYRDVIEDYFRELADTKPTEP
ncbi:MAG: hypothetical protein K8T25_15010 [Planctomycetia bacterium]|nr:hypothetical protein [Planctomycetia bacterium]